MTTIFHKSEVLLATVEIGSDLVPFQRDTIRSGQQRLGCDITIVTPQSLCHMGVAVGTAEQNNVKCKYQNFQTQYEILFLLSGLQ